MAKTTVAFFGSFQHYSSLILEGLLATPELEVVLVVTTPAHEGVTNPVEVLAKQHAIPVLTELEMPKSQSPDLLLTAGYGQLLPETWLKWPRLAALNLHFSLLPRWRGANPAEWALLAGETETGITLIEMSPEFDTGKLVAQASLPLSDHDTRETVYQKLYELGRQTIGEMLQAYIAFKGGQSISTANEVRTFLPPVPQTDSPTPYAKRFKREDGLVDWLAFVAAMKGETAAPSLASPQLQKVLSWSHQELDAHFITRATQALLGFPNLWTTIPTAKGDQRMKILSCHVEGNKLVLDQVQIAGKNPSRWAESKNIVTA